MMIPWLDANEFKDGIDLIQVVNRLNEWDWEKFDENRFLLAKRLQKFFLDNNVLLGGKLDSIISSYDQSRVKSHCLPPNQEYVHQGSTITGFDRFPKIFAHAANLFSHESPRVLSFGCSNGLETLTLATNYFPFSYIDGVDINATQVSIAKQANQLPFRVKHYTSTAFSECYNNTPREQYDIIFAMSVFCKWPDTKAKSDISELYPFSHFHDELTNLISHLKRGGFLVALNCNYLISEAAADLLSIPDAGLRLPSSIGIFNPQGKPLTEASDIDIIFQKK
jgi:hypothetical protein